MSQYHRPVMVSECLEALNINPKGIYVDLTFGGGGHTREILKRLSTGKLYAFDQDLDAKREAEKIKDDSFFFIDANFRHMLKYLKLYGVKLVDGILADLGVSSHQIDEPERGFSTRFNADLDMRMDQKRNLTAREILNTYPVLKLHRIFGQYGELRNARSLARKVVSERSKSEIKTVENLLTILKPLARRGKESKYFAQVFQALRIEVNQEIQALKEMLVQTSDVIRKGGRLAVLSYHSLEDRTVKQYINTGKFTGEGERDVFGNVLRPFNPISRKPVRPSPDEININYRARSARLRFAEKN